MKPEQIVASAEKLERQKQRSEAKRLIQARVEDRIKKQTAIDSVNLRELRQQKGQLTGAAQERKIVEIEELKSSQEARMRDLEAMKRVASEYNPIAVQVVQLDKIPGNHSHYDNNPDIFAPKPINSPKPPAPQQLLESKVVPGSSSFNGGLTYTVGIRAPQDELRSTRLNSKPNRGENNPDVVRCGDGTDPELGIIQLENGQVAIVYSKVQGTVVEESSSGKTRVDVNNGYIQVLLYDPTNEATRKPVSESPSETK